jgi:hypothetical protein
LAGLNFLFHDKKKYGSIFLFLGSYSLVSTKNYLWAILMITVVLTCIILLFLRYEYRKVIVLSIAGFLLPTIAFASTTSAYALNHLFSAKITETGARSGDSITQVYIDTQDAVDTGSGISKPTRELVTFHGDSSLIALHFYLTDTPESPISKTLRFIHLDKKIQSIWDEKVAKGLIHRDKEVGADTSSLNGHIIKPGDISQPLTLFWAAFVFLCGPFPFIGDPGFAISIAALESPLWWLFYAIVIFQFIRFRKVKFVRDPQILFISIFLAGEIAFSALIEVNLGTAFRHRSILLAPLIFLYIRLEQLAKEQRDQRIVSVS